MKVRWKNETRRLEDLLPMPCNPRRLTDEQRTQLGESLGRFGLADPIVVNRSGAVIGGHQRLKVLADAGVETVDVRVPDRDLSPEEEQELNLRLNKNGGEWDPDLLADHYQPDLLNQVGFVEAEYRPPRPGLEDGFPEDGEGAPRVGDRADCVIVIGEVRCKVARDEYEAWIEELRQTVGFEDAQIIAELRRRLAL